MKFNFLHKRLKNTQLLSQKGFLTSRLYRSGIIALLLVGCHSTTLQPIQLPNQFDQQVFNPANTKTEFPPIGQLTVLDFRTHQHAIRVHKNKPPAEFATIQPSLTSAVQTLIESSLPMATQRDAQAPLKLHIELKKTLCITQQKPFSFQTDCEAEFYVQLSLNSLTWHKTYQTQRSRSGQLSHAQNDRIQDLNFVVQTTLAQFLTDPDWIHWYDSH